MFKLYDADEKLTMTEIPFKQESLDTNNTFLIDKEKWFIFDVEKRVVNKKKD